MQGPLNQEFAAALAAALGTALASMREARATDYGQISELVHRALKEKLGETYVGAGWYPRSVSAEKVVISREGRYWAYPYTLGEENNVTLGEPEEVVEQFAPVAMREAAFLEAKDAEGTVWEATLIRAGASKNGWYYPDAVLREAVPLFEGARVFAKPDVEHSRGDGKDVRKLVGWIAAPRFVEGARPDTGRIAGTLNLSAAAEYERTLLADAWRRGKRDLAGLSIDAAGKAGKAEMREGRRVRVAKRIDRVESVDLIVEASAGGELVRMVESSQGDSDMMLRERMLQTIKEKSPQAYAKLDPDAVTEEALEAAYREAVAAPAAPATAPATDFGAAVTEAVRLAEARMAARVKIQTCGLPKPAQERLAAQFGSDAQFTEADVEAAIKAEREYLAKFTESGHVQLGGLADISVEDRGKKMAEMLDKFFDPKDKSVISLRECYIEFTGDRRVTGRLEDCDRARLRESGFREAVSTTQWADAFGASITRRMIAEYNVEDIYSVWRFAANVVPVDDFRTQERVRIGGYANLPTVNEAAAYTALTSPADEAATYAVTKRGGTEVVTLEAIRNNDVGAVQMIPTKLAMAAKRTLSEFVLDFIRTNPTIYDSVALYHATHNNLFATALDAAQYAAHRVAMLKQTELTSGKRLGIAPSYLWVPFDLEEAAINLFTQGTENEQKFLSRIRPTVIGVWYWTDANDWATSADTRVCPFIEVGFLDGREEPELFVQDLPNVGSLFTNDQITYKIRHVYGGAVKDFRGTTKAVVA